MAGEPKRRVIDIDDGPKIDLDIDPDVVDFIIVRAREFDVKVPETDPDDGSNPTDDNDLSILEDDPDDLTETELRDAIDGLSDDAAHDLVALYWIGRGDFTPAEWKAGARPVDRARRPRQYQRVSAGRAESRRFPGRRHEPNRQLFDKQ